MTAYHVTPRRNVASILRDGLRGCDWGPPFPPLAWFFRDETDARAFLVRPWAGSRETALLEVDLDGYDVGPDPHPGFEGVATVAAVVPPERPIPRARIRVLPGCEAES